MRDKILEIICDCALFENGSENAATEITSLMCYQEAISFIKGIGIRGYGKGEIYALCYNWLKTNYDEQIIIKVIEQIKAEQK